MLFVLICKAVYFLAHWCPHLAIEGCVHLFKSGAIKFSINFMQHLILGIHALHSQPLNLDVWLVFVLDCSKISNHNCSLSFLSVSILGWEYSFLTLKLLFWTK